MKIGLASAPFINNDVTSNIRTILKYMQDAKIENTDLLLFGECFLQGFEALNWDPINDVNIGIEKNSETIMLIREHCKKINIALGVGYIEKDNEKLFCSYLIIDKNGNELTNYKRISTGWRYQKVDKKFYKEGKEFEPFEYMGHKMIVGICGDFWEDEVIKVIPKGIDVILWPNFCNYTPSEWEFFEGEYTRLEYFKKAKTISNNIFFINSICKEEKCLAYGGAFAIINNKLKYELKWGEEGILYCDY